LARYDGRSIRHVKDALKSDPDSLEYWEAVLCREGLSMSRGKTGRLSYHAPDKLAHIAARRAGVEPDSGL
jgi:hypothetical protein